MTGIELDTNSAAWEVGPNDPGTSPRLPRRVLYIQHAGALGGSVMSLRYLVEAVQDRGIECVIALARPSEELVNFYRRAGVRTLAAPDLVCWDHSTVAPQPLWNPRFAADFARVCARWGAGKAATMALVEDVRPDVVHLNSMPLSCSAEALASAGVPFVWHVREPPPDQSVRTRMIRRIMNASSHMIFITEYDRSHWRPRSGGKVIYNCVPDEWFQGQPPMDVRDVDSENRPVRFAYLGGMAGTKGAKLLLRALEVLRKRSVHWQCIMPGALESPGAAKSWRRRAAERVGLVSPRVRLCERFRRLGSLVDLRRFDHAVKDTLRGVDFVVFPATTPHFARPIIEAAALGKPAVATALGGIDECVVNRETGLLTGRGNATALADGIEQMLLDSRFRRECGEQAALRARSMFSRTSHVNAVLQVYAECLATQS